MNSIKKTNVLLFGSLLILVAVILMAADHIDAPGIRLADGGDARADIADFYAYEGANPDNTVFATTVQGLQMPGADASFDEDILIEINIDNDGDMVEDMVIQAIPRDGTMYFFGPYSPSNTGLNSVIDETTSLRGEVAISTGAAANTATANGISYFAGLREDPFFFDFDRFSQVIRGQVVPEGFNRNGTDTFDGTNVLAVVIEVPNSLLGGTFSHPAGTNVEVFNAWVETKRKQ